MLKTWLLWAVKPTKDGEAVKILDSGSDLDAMKVKLKALKVDERSNDYSAAGITRLKHKYRLRPKSKAKPKDD